MAPVDLLSWPDLAEAEGRVTTAETAVREAQRRYWLAPHGRRRERLSALKEASAAALRAGVELARLQRDAEG